MEALTWAIGQEKEIKDIQIGKDKVFSSHTWHGLMCRNPKEST